MKTVKYGKEARECFNKYKGKNISIIRRYWMNYAEIIELALDVDFQKDVRRIKYDGNLNLRSKNEIKRKYNQWLKKNFI